MKVIPLDSAPLSLLTKSKNDPEARAIGLWVDGHLHAGNQIIVPEIVDYELRRELLRSGKTSSLLRLDNLKMSLKYQQLTTSATQFAAQLGANSRNQRLATGDPKKLDVDVILAAQALTLGVPIADLIIATSNVAHLSRFAPADLWQNILL